MPHELARLDRSFTLLIILYQSVFIYSSYCLYYIMGPLIIVDRKHEELTHKKRRLDYFL